MKAKKKLTGKQKQEPEQQTPKPEPATDTNLSHWLDKQDLLQALHISERTLQYWRSKGLLPFCKVGNKIFYYIYDVVALISTSQNL